MFRRFLRVIIVSLIIMSSACVPVYADRLDLGVPNYQQEGTLWRWAAGNKSVIQFYKKTSPTQTQIVDYHFNPPFTGNEGATIDQIGSALAHWNVAHYDESGPLDLSTIKSLIDISKPIESILYNYDGGHLNVISGYNTDSGYLDWILFVDPADGQGHGQSISSYTRGVHYNGAYYNWACTIKTTW